MDNGELILGYFKYLCITPRKIDKFEIPAMHVYWDQDKLLNKKTGVRKYHCTIPFKQKLMLLLYEHGSKSLVKFLHRFGEPLVNIHWKYFSMHIPVLSDRKVMVALIYFTEFFK